MKHTSLLSVLASLLASVCPSLAEERTHFFDFLKIEVREVLDFYQQVSGLDLVTDSGVGEVSAVPIRLHFERPVSTAEAVRLFETMLAEEAGVFITRLDHKRAWVTHNGGLTANQPSLRLDNAQLKEEVEFLAAVRTAFENHDADLLEALTSWEGVPDFLADRTKRQCKTMAACTLAQLRLSAWNPTMPDLKQEDELAVPLRTSLPITWKLKITFAESCEFMELPPGMPLFQATGIERSAGETDGQLYMLVYLPAK
jgi:hypothetical protein